MPEKLKIESQYFLENKARFEAKYKNRTIVIVGTKVIDDYKDINEAFSFASLRFEPGTFLIKTIDDNPTIFHTRVSF